MSKESKKCKKMYFNELEMTEYDTRSVPEGEFRDFCQFWPFNWSSKSQSCILKLLGGTKKCSPQVGGWIDKSLCFLPLWWAKLVFLLLLCMLKDVCEGNLCQF